MAPRPTWKGYLKVSLVNIPVKVFPATESAASISLQPAPRRVPDAHPAEEVVPALRPRGAQLRDRQGLRVREGPLGRRRRKRTSRRSGRSRRGSSTWCSSPTTTAIDPIYVDRAYYLAPDGRMAADAFAVMREGMAGKAGIGKVALYGREYLVAVRPQKKGLVMYTLHHDAEIRSIDQVEELNSVPTKVKPEEMKLAKQVIAPSRANSNLKDYKDEYQEGLRKIIDAKMAGEEVVAPEVQEPPKVVDLMEALRRSLNAVSDREEEAGEGEDRRPAPKAKAVAAAGSGRRPSGLQPRAFGRGSGCIGDALPDAVRHVGQLHGFHAVVEEPGAEHGQQAVAQHSSQPGADPGLERAQQQEQHDARRSQQRAHDRADAPRRDARIFLHERADGGQPVDLRLDWRRDPDSTARRARKPARGRPLATRRSPRHQDGPLTLTR